MRKTDRGNTEEPEGCAICGEPINGPGHFAYPVVSDSDAKCCDCCQMMYVKPAIVALAWGTRPTILDLCNKLNDNGYNYEGLEKIANRWSYQSEEEDRVALDMRIELHDQLLTLGERVQVYKVHYRIMEALESLEHTLFQNDLITYTVLDEIDPDA